MTTNIIRSVDKRDAVFPFADPVPEECSSVADALEWSQCNFHVQSWDVLLRHPHTGVVIPYPKKRGTVRDHPQIPFGIVSDKYSIIQNAAAFKPVDLLISEGLAKIIGCGGFDGGKKVYIQAEWTDQGHETLGNGIQTTTLFGTDHGGDGALNALNCNQVVVCRNTYNMALKEGWKSRFSIRHTADWAEHMQELMSIYKNAIEHKAQLRDVANVWSQIEFDETDRVWLVKSLMPAKDEDEVATRTANRRGSLADALFLPTGGWGGTAWGTLQGVTEWVDWHRPVRPEAGSPEYAGAVKKQAENSLIGVGAAFKQRGYDLIRQRVEARG